MFFDRAKELILRGEFLESLDLLEELQRVPDKTIFDELEIITLQFIIQRRLRNYPIRADYTNQIKNIYERITHKHPEIKEISNNLTYFTQQKVTFDSFNDSIESLSSIIQQRIPLLLFVGVQFFTESQIFFDFPLNNINLVELSCIFKKYGDHVFYSELLILITWSYLYRWENKIALELANEYLKICEENKDYYGITVSFVTIASIYADMGNCKEAIDYSFKYLEHAEKLGIINIIWHAYFAIALHYAYADDLSNALIYDTKCSELEQHPDFTDTRTSSTRMLITVHINLKKGDANLALEQMLGILEKCGNQMDPYSLAMAYGVIADIYSQKNEYSLALEYYHKGLEIREKFGGYTIVANNYFHIFEINLHLGLEKNAVDYLEKLKKIKEETDEELVNNLYSFSKALYLKSRNDAENRFEAKKMLIDLISTESPYHKTADRSYLHLCDILLEEIKSSEDASIIQTLQNYIKELTLKATLAQSNLLLIELYFLQSKILLLDLKVEEAISLLEQSQDLAREKGITRLEILLSNEYDLLLHQLDKWEEFSSYLPTLDERLELTHIEDLVNRMMRKWVVYGAVTPEDESPQYFIIMTEEGSIIFSEAFPSSAFESEMIAEILSKIKRLKTELKTIQKPLRFRCKQYSCLLSKEQDLLFCYIFMGNSYVPISKLHRFFQLFSESSSLSRLKQTWLIDKTIDFDSRAKLSSLVEEVFL